MNNVSISGKVYEVNTATLSNGKTVSKVIVQVYGAGDFVDGKSKPGFIKAEFWDKQSEFVQKNFEKGSYIGVTGQWRQKSFEDKNGNKRQDNFIGMANATFEGAPTETTSAPTTGSGTSSSGEVDPFVFDDLPAI